MLQDIRHSFRVLAKNPLFALVGIVTLALGCGATTAVFDDPNLIASAGLVPMLALADLAGLAELVQERGLVDVGPEHHDQSRCRSPWLDRELVRRGRKTPR